MAVTGLGQIIAAAAGVSDVVGTAFGTRAAYSQPAVELREEQTAEVELTIATIETVALVGRRMTS